MPITSPLTNHQAALVDAENPTNAYVGLGTRIQTIETDVGNVASLTTASQVVVGAINEVAASVPPFDATAPADVSTSAASVGVATSAARRDHVHLLVAVATSAGAADAGKVLKLNGSGLVDPSTNSFDPSTPADVSTSAGAVGVGTKPARSDHVHKLAATATSAGAGDSGKAVLADATGHLSGTFLGRPQVKAAAADRITNTAALTDFATTATLPASPVQGTHFQITANIKQVATNGADTVAIDIYVGSVSVVSFPATNVLAGNVVTLVADVYVQVAGAGGSLTAFGLTELATSSPTFHGDTADSTAIDWTVAQTITVKAQQSVANAGNQTDLRTLEWSIVGAPT